MAKYGMVDNGKRQSFGKDRAIRDTCDDKPRPDLISPFAEERQGQWLLMGATKYAERNWEKGMPFSRCVASLKRHLMRFQQGKKDEDHLAAIMFNAMAIIHYEEMIERGILPAELNDMPNYTAKKAKKPAKRPAKKPVQKKRGRK
ncbi:MAG: dATP/dGTP diphosphohydrolase domain-containing protein [Thermoguttaceae bacterium]